jgi:hypothetical protein
MNLIKLKAESGLVKKVRGYAFLIGRKLELPILRSNSKPDMQDSSGPNFTPCQWATVIIRQWLCRVENS